MIPALDEPTLRTPTWEAGTRVRLADGQEWALPPLPLAWGHRRLLDGRLDLQPRWLPEITCELIRLSFKPDPLATYHHLFNIVMLLLQENYWLDSAQCAALLPFDPMQPEFIVTLESVGAGDHSAIEAAMAIGEHIGPALTSIRRWQAGHQPPVAAADPI